MKGNGSQSRYATKFIISQNKEGQQREAAGPNAQSAFLQETKDKLHR